MANKPIVKRPASLKRQIVNRMHYVRGHLDAVLEMVEADAYCPDIVVQNLAVISALKRVNELVLASHLKSCAVEAMRGRNARARERVFREIINIVRNAS